LNDLAMRDTLRRKENVAERIKNAYKAMRMILLFVKRNRLPWDYYHDATRSSGP
jgi:hypothetical protein